MRVKPPKATYTFDLQLAGCSWPDADFHLEFDAPISSDTMCTIEIKIGDFVNVWNEQEEKNGQQDFIHNMLDIRRIDETSCEFHIDFGSASELVLIKFFNFLQELCGPQLKQVILS